MPKVVQNKVYLLYTDGTYSEDKYYRSNEAYDTFKFFVRQCIDGEFSSCAAVIITCGDVIEAIYKSNVRLRYCEELNINDLMFNLNFQ